MVQTADYGIIGPTNQLRGVRKSIKNITVIGVGYVELADDPYTLAEGCDALIVITEWNEFKHLGLKRIRDLMNQPVFIDGRNIYDPETMNELGFYYRGVGRGYGSME